MFINFLIVLIVLLLVLVLWGINTNTQLIYRNLTKDRDLDEARWNRAEHTLKQIRDMAQLVVDCQGALDEQLDDVKRIIYEYNTSANLQLQKLTDLMQSDVLAARRNELMRTREAKAALERVVTLTTMARQQPTSQDIIALESFTIRVEELEKILEIKSGVI